MRFNKGWHMKKVISLIILMLFLTNQVIAACSITGGACSIENVKTKKESKLQNSKQKNIKKENSITNKKDSLKNKKRDGKINYRPKQVMII